MVAGIVQGFSPPPLMVLIMLLTNRRRREIMGDHGDKVNGRWINVPDWTTTGVIFAASFCLLFSYLHG